MIIIRALHVAAVWRDVKSLDFTNLVTNYYAKSNYSRKYPNGKKLISSSLLEFCFEFKIRHISGMD